VSNTTVASRLIARAADRLAGLNDSQPGAGPAELRQIAEALLDASAMLLQAAGDIEAGIEG
jgi:hypothetical protein